MYRHVVFWRFREDAAEEAAAFVAALNGLVGVIPQIRSARATLNTNPANGLCGVLISDFDSKEDMEAYKADPRHQAVSARCKAIRLSREAVDFEL